MDASTPGVVQPHLLKRVEPRIPRGYRKSGNLSPVEVKLLIAESGRVQEAVVMNPGANHANVNSAVSEACRRWEFKPALKHGIPVKTWKTYKFSFPIE